MEKSKQSVFDDYQEVKQLKDCNQCERYYVNQCDGVKKGENKSCREFLATRKVNIPEEIESLRKQISRLRTCSILQSVAIIIYCIGVLLNA